MRAQPSTITRHAPPALANRACRMLAAACAGLLLLIGWGLATASATETEPAANSRQARDEALRHMPLAKLSPTDRQRVAGVLANPTIYRKLPTQVIQCDPTMYLFLVEHPEVIVNTWQVMEVTEIKLDRTGANQFNVNDGAGTRGTVQVLARGHDAHLLLCHGSYEGPLFNRKLTGSAVVLLRSDYVRETDGRQYVTCRLDAFVQFDQVGADVFARTFQPVVGQVADHNFRETATFLQTVNATAEHNYEGMRRLANRLTAVQPDIRERFAKLSEEVAVRAATGHTEVRMAETQPPPAATTVAPPVDAATPPPPANTRPTAATGVSRPPSFRR